MILAHSNPPNEGAVPPCETTAKGQVHRPVRQLFSTINIELTSRCNKSCWHCGRRKMERDYLELVKNWGDIDFDLVVDIARQLPDGIFVHLHNNGEPLLYPRFGEAVKLFDRQFTHITTNGKLLMEKFDEIVDNLDTLAVSIVQGDPEADEQYDILYDFMRYKGNKRPRVVLRFVGDVDTDRYGQFPAAIAKRVLHDPMGSFDYKKNPTVPETGVCQDFLNHPAIDRFGDMSICVRFDPQRVGVLGNVNKKSIRELWNSDKRRRWLNFHLQGKRGMVPLCCKCEYWGIPTGS